MQSAAERWELNFQQRLRAGCVFISQSGLSEDQRAIVTAKNLGELKLVTVISSIRSCFPGFKASGRGALKTRPPAGAILVDDEEWREEDVNVEPASSSGDAVVFEEVEAFVGEHGVQLEEIPPGHVFTEKETVEILAATWKEKRAEIARLQRSRKFNQATIVKKKFIGEVDEVRRQTQMPKGGSLGSQLSQPRRQG